MCVVCGRHPGERWHLQRSLGPSTCEKWPQLNLETLVLANANTLNAIDLFGICVERFAPPGCFWLWGTQSSTNAAYSGSSGGFGRGWLRIIINHAPPWDRPQHTLIASKEGKGNKPFAKVVRAQASKNQKIMNSAALNCRIIFPGRDRHE